MAFYISIEGLGWAVLLLAAYALVLLFLFFLSLLLIFRSRHSTRLGVALMAGLLIYGFGPELYAAFTNRQLEARMTALSYWPEDLPVAGKRLAFLSPSAFGCKGLCEAAARYGEAEHVQAWGLSIVVEAPADGGLDWAGLPTRDVTLEPSRFDEGAFDLGTVAAAQMAPDYVIVAGFDGRLAQQMPGLFDLTAAEVRGVTRAVAVFEGVPAPGDAPLLRMLSGRAQEFTPFLPFFSNGALVPDYDLYLEPWQRWLCGDRADETFDCRYIY